MRTMKRILMASLIGMTVVLPLSAKTLRGTIKVFGTEPQTSLGIETSDGKRYGIITGTILREELFNQQGTLLKLKGTKQKKGQNPQTDLEDGSFYVKSYTVIQ